MVRRLPAAVQAENRRRVRPPPLEVVDLAAVDDGEPAATARGNVVAGNVHAERLQGAGFRVRIEPRTPNPCDIQALYVAFACDSTTLPFCVSAWTIASPVLVTQASLTMSSP